MARHRDGQPVIPKARYRTRDEALTPTKVRLSRHDRSIIADTADAIAKATGRRPSMASVISMLLKQAAAVVGATA